MASSPIHRQWVTAAMHPSGSNTGLSVLHKDTARDKYGVGFELPTLQWTTCSTSEATVTPIC